MHVGSFTGNSTGGSGPFGDITPEEKIISRRPFPYTRLASDFFHFVELPVDQTDSFSVVKNIIQQAGMERFMHFFLSDETNLSPEQIAANCLYSIDDVIATFNFLNQAYVPSGKIGEIICEQYITARGEENERLVIAFYSPLYARGLYEINYRLLPFAIKKIACEENHIRRLIRAIELVNLRMNIMYKLIQNILFMQKKFCKSGGLNDRIRLTQLDMAQHMQLDKSIICRTIRGRSLVIQGSEIPLKDFFPGRKKIMIELLGQILRSERRPMTDEALRKKLFAQSRITISRRSVSAYRKKLAVPSSFKRKKERGQTLK